MLAWEKVSLQKGSSGIHKIFGLFYTGTSRVFLLFFWMLQYALSELYFLISTNYYTANLHIAGEILLKYFKLPLQIESSLTCLMYCESYFINTAIFQV